MDALQRSSNTDLAGIAAKAVKEARYHVRHSAQWVVTLGDGTRIEAQPAAAISNTKPPARETISLGR